MTNYTKKQFLEDYIELKDLYTNTRDYFHHNHYEMNSQREANMIHWITCTQFKLDEYTTFIMEDDFTFLNDDVQRMMNFITLKRESL